MPTYWQAFQEWCAKYEHDCDEYDFCCWMLTYHREQIEASAAVWPHNYPENVVPKPEASTEKGE